MASSYPTGLDSFATNRVDGTDMGDDTPGSVAVGTHAGDHNNLADAVNKIEIELGTDPSGASATVAARATAVEGRATALETLVPSAPVLASVVDAAGDLIVGSADNTVTRLAKGSNGTWLRVTGGALVYSTIALADIPMTGAVDGEVLTSVSGVASWEASGAGAITKIADTTVTGSVAATIDFSSIASTYTALKLIMYVRGDTAATFTELRLRLNNDSGSNYDSNVNGMAATTTQGYEAVAATSISLQRMAASTAPANSFSPCELVLPDYTNTTNHKTTTSHGGTRYTAASTGMLTDTGFGLWRSTSAVNRITLLPLAGNFAIGSRAILYGLG